MTQERMISNFNSYKSSEIKKGSLIIVGSGFQAVRHITLEARQAIEQADKVLYMVDDPVFDIWIKKVRPDAESLKDLYGIGKPYTETYEQMTEVTLKYVREGLNVCVVYYGHPGVFVNPSHESIRQARSEGFEARMHPGISAEDCLFADLGIDPKIGCQSFEATDFLIRKHKFDTSCHVILWQIGAIGQPLGKPLHDPRASLEILVSFLKHHYDSNHTVFVYEAAEYVIEKPLILNFTLSKLPEAPVSSRSTLYIPPATNPPVDHKLHERLRRASEGKVVEMHFSKKKLFRLG